MNTDTLIRVMLSIFPDSQIGEDNDGQIVVYTGLRIGDTTDGTEPLVPFTEGQ